MASLAFKALSEGAERIPDAAFEKIPFAGRYFKSPDNIEADRRKRHEEKDRKKGRSKSRHRDDDRSHHGDRRDRHHRDYDTDPYDSQPDSEYERAQRRARRSHRRSERARGREQDGLPDRGYESDHVSSYGNANRAANAPAGYNQAPYFPPPPTFAVDEQQQQGPRFVPDGAATAPRGYNPEDYNDQPISPHSYSPGYPQGGPPSYAPPPFPPPSPQSYQTPPPPSTGQPRAADPTEHSSAAERYRPANYYDQYSRNLSPGSQREPNINRNTASPNPAYPSALAVRPPSEYDQYPDQSVYNSYRPSYDRDDDEKGSRHRSDRSHSRRRSGSRDSRPAHSHKSSRSMSRVGERAKEGFEKHKKEAGASAIGAIAGGVLGNLLGGKHNKNGMLLGAAIGGIGGNLVAGQREKKKRASKNYVKDGYESY